VFAKNQIRKTENMHGIVASRPPAGKKYLIASP
jgi:hypothetical protein